MKFIIFFLVLTCVGTVLLAQEFSQNILLNNQESLAKPSIDIEAINKWPLLRRPLLSSNGKFALYTIYDGSTNNSTLVLQDTKKDWKKEIILKGFSSSYFFSRDSKKMIYLESDTLCILTLKNGKVDFISHVASYKLSNTGRDEWLAYMQNNANNEMVLRDLTSGKERRFPEVTDYLFDAHGNSLLMKTDFNRDNRHVFSLQWIDLYVGKPITIWTSTSFSEKSAMVGGYQIDAEGKQLVFTVQKKDSTKLDSISQTNTSIWYYKTGMEKAVMRINDQSAGIDAGLCLSNITPEFTQNGLNILFWLQPLISIQKPKPDAVMLDVWSYKDVILQSEQLNVGFYQNKKCLAVLNLQANKVIRLEKEGERLETYANEVTTNYVVVSDKQDVQWWQKNYNQSFYVRSLEDGSSKLLKKGWPLNITFSPLGNYIIYFDGEQKNYFSYNLKTGISYNISKTISVRLDNEYAFYVPGRTAPVPFDIAYWLEKEIALLIYDNYDIWMLDPTGKKLPINITNGYGYRNHIKLRLAYEKRTLIGLSAQTSLLLKAFNTINKKNGFYRTFLDKKEDPKFLTMEPALFCRDNSQIPNSDGFSDGMEPVKAENSNTWIVERQTSSESPNYFLTTDFKTYRPLTNLQPQKAYNWLTTELVTWMQLDGTLSQGILYKPDDFDPHKKYPIIFSFYETFSYRMFEFPRPDYATGRIDIPWYVSRGYLVFTPDIHYSIASISGKTVGDCAYNSVVSAAKYFSQLSYVDGSRIGIQGHSYSGYEALYLITHSQLFAAAAEGSGTTSNEISVYLGLVSPSGRPEGSKQDHAEIGHDRIGATLWQRPDLYIRYSPVFNADQVTTPLLIMHNYGDYAVDWGQGVEMFMALRRLEKKVWMLQYDGQDHVLDGKSAIDYTIRMQQFFDHYLKGLPPPLWMTIGIPSKLKGIDYGLELDYSGKQP